jgi:AraC family transcriptional regulator of adaptative response / methylphosphotriester-DNA alkyltransferase methyltransferase
MQQFNDDIMWQAVITNDQSFDGLFYYGVSTTGIFCRPSCKSKVPKRQNVHFFPDANQAVAEGFHACKRCRPELMEPSPEPMVEIITRVTDILLTEYSDPELLENLPVRVGISASHLQHWFKKITGLTPKVFLQNIRIRKAEELLVTHPRDNTTICFEVGFQSLSCFYAAFRRVTRTSPREYRVRNCGNHAGGGNDGIGI